MTFGIIASSHPLAALGYSGEVLADSPLVYYRLGEASGTTCTDSSGNGRNATYSGTVTLGQPSLLASDSDTSAEFAGGAAGIASAAWMNVSNLTAEAWVLSTSWGAIETVVNRFDLSSGYQFHLSVVSGNAYFRVSINGGTQVQAVGSTSLSTSTIYHLAGTWDGRYARVYVNGSLDGTYDHGSSATLDSPTRNLSIGRFTQFGSYTSTYQFTGDIDEVAVYGTALSSTRIAAHYSAGTA